MIWLESYIPQSTNRVGDRNGATRARSGVGRDVPILRARPVWLLNEGSSYVGLYIDIWGALTYMRAPHITIFSPTYLYWDCFNFVIRRAEICILNKILADVCSVSYHKLWLTSIYPVFVWLWLTDMYIWIMIRTRLKIHCCRSTGYTQIRWGSHAWGTL